MSDTQPIIPMQDEPAVYEIRLKGQLTDRWAGWFGDVSINLSTSSPRPSTLGI